jgi:hypothetical protein
VTTCFQPAQQRFHNVQDPVMAGKSFLTIKYIAFAMVRFVAITVCLHVHCLILSHHDKIALLLCHIFHPAQLGIQCKLCIDNASKNVSQVLHMRGAHTAS